MQERQADAEYQEIEITPEMIEAGYTAFLRYRIEDMEAGDQGPMIEDILISALAAQKSRA